MSDTDRPSAVARQQARLRGLNADATFASLESDADAVTILCECGRTGCDAQLNLSRELYRGVRRHDGWSVVLDGHEVPEVDRVIQRRGTVAIVESTYVGNGGPPV